MALERGRQNNVSAEATRDWWGMLIHDLGPIARLSPAQEKSVLSRIREAKSLQTGPIHPLIKTQLTQEINTLTTSIVASHIGFIRGFARRIAWGREDLLQDIMSAGIEKLVDAIDRVDTNSEFHLLSYAGKGMKRAMIFEMLNLTLPLTIEPEELSKLRYATYNKEGPQLEATVKEFADKFNLDSSTVLGMISSTVSFEEPTDKGNTPSSRRTPTTIGETIADPTNGLSLEDNILRNEFPEELESAIQSLPKTQQEIVRLRYHLAEDGTANSIQNIAEILELSPNKVKAQLGLAHLLIRESLDENEKTERSEQVV